MSGEKRTDQFVRDMLRAVGFERPWEQDCGGAPQYIYDALEGASKGLGGGRGKPEFLVESGDFLVVVEDKADISRLSCPSEGVPDLEYPARKDYALNGASHYARFLADRTGRGVFAVGVAGRESHHRIAVAYTAKDSPPLRLPRVDTFTNFARENIGEYHRVAVLGELPQEEREVRELRKVAAEMHENMRNYASLEGERKSTLVAAILLALEYHPDLIKELVGEEREGFTDGEKVYKAAAEYVKNIPEDKAVILLEQFSFMRRHPLLNRVNRDIDMTPMRHYVETLKFNVMYAVADPSHSAFDVLGNFYGEFVKYGGSDGNTLGIVLTPRHITELMVELIDVNADDYVIDPAAGTASFLIAAMRKMFKDAESRFKDNKAALEKKIKSIREKQLHGVELQDKLFAVGTTNMILRGDGKANFQRNSIFNLSAEELKGEHPFTKALINPPYSQAKKETRHLSELSFIERTLSLLNRGGCLAAIVPQSAMVGKTKEDRVLKDKILLRHTLDAVITMNPDTFYRVGVHTVIALFTAGVPHPSEKKTAFINFKDDGYKVRKHVGLMGDGNERERRAYLLSVLRDGVSDDTSFVIRAEVTAEDEWQHSYFYFNDQPPSYEDFLATVADYVTWQVDMHAHGKGELVSPGFEPAERGGE